MKKKNFVTLIMSTIGGILFAIGMCMCMLPEWNAFKQGVIIGVIGAVVLLAMLVVRRKMEGKPAIHLSGKAIGTVLLGVVGAVVLGIGMCMVMVWSMMVQGILVGLVGIILLLCLIPVVKGLKKGGRAMSKVIIPVIGAAAIAGVGAVIISRIRNSKKK